jgi:glucose/arabinose dehydrogenase
MHKSFQNRVKTRSYVAAIVLPAIVALTIIPGTTGPAHAQGPGPTVLDPNLAVRAAATGLDTPISMAFLGASDMLVLEKNTGKVQRVVGGVVQGTALDLPVNSFSERGLLGIALHPDFPATPWVYLYWTESSTRVDTIDPAQVPLLGNRVDRFAWNGETLAFNRNIVRLRAFQADEGQPLRGNHNGGVIRFGPDGKLYVIIGDNGRRGMMQNLPFGPTETGLPVRDDQFGGPQPDNAHLTGVILRLNDNGSAPSDNPFAGIGDIKGVGRQVTANARKIFAYGVRNSFGLAFDPLSGNLWDAEPGDDSFDELNLVQPGSNLGWIQVAGPISRVAEFKAIETSAEFFGLQQIRWPPTRIADTPAQAFSRLFLIPGSFYNDPEFSWKYAVSPGAIGFLNSEALGAGYFGSLFVGSASFGLEGGYLFRFDLNASRDRVSLGDARLADRVADNLTKNDITESESLLFGRNFGIVSDIQTGPNGNLFLVALASGTIYEIYRP